MILLFLTSGLFLGWSLGANDASHIFGSAVGSKMVSFRKAALIASLFFILGAVLQGSGTSHTLARLGSVNALGGSFTVALAAAITIYGMTRWGLPVSTTQAIVGAILGWNLFTGCSTDTRVLAQIVSGWLAGPLIGALLSITLYVVVRKVKTISGIHIIRFESWVRKGLIAAGAFGAYSLGANNIANVMGVFVPAFSLDPIQFGPLLLDSQRQLFLLGGFAIAAGILTYSRKVMDTVGSNIVELSSEAALVVVLAESAVLFMFSSQTLSSWLAEAGLPAIPLVPVSSSQVIVGCIIGIGLYKGAGNINFRVLGDIGLAWLISPVVSGLLCFVSLFFISNIFGIAVTTPSGEMATKAVSASGQGISALVRYFIMAIIISAILGAIYYAILQARKTAGSRRSEERIRRYFR